MATMANREHEVTREFAAIVLDASATPETFDEAGYLAANPDVANAVRTGIFSSGRAHFDVHGKNEGRSIRRMASIHPMRAAKMRRAEGILRDDLPFERIGLKYDFLTPELRVSSKIADTENVSQNGYGIECLSLIDEFKDGLILDCGSGRRPIYYSNVMNYEIVDYDTTDVIGIGEVLPFKDNSFDAVLSVAVLEHVRDPFVCAAELARVLKPGGKLYCSVPFLQPLHGYPHHYYNMTHQGARNLFDDKLVIDSVEVTGPAKPIWALTWIIRSWAAGLSEDARRQFLEMPVKELTRNASELEGADWVKGLSSEKEFELACGTMLLAHKALE